MSRLARWIAVVLIVIGAPNVFLLSATYFGLPWWRYSLGETSYLGSPPSATLWSVAIGFGSSVFIARDRGGAALSLRFVALLYASVGLASVSLKYILWDYYASSAWGEIAQLLIGSAPLWCAVAMSLLVSCIPSTNRWCAVAIVIGTFWVCVYAQKAVWAPCVIPYLAHLA